MNRRPQIFSSVGAEFSRDIQEDDYSLSFSYYQKNFLSQTNFFANGFGDEVLTTFGREIYYNESLGFPTICGDKVVSSGQESISVFANVKVNFESSYTKNIVGGKLDVGVSFLNFGVALQKASSTLQENLSISISALQTGGDASQLAKIFESPNSNSSFVLSCTMQNYASCQNIVQGILNYAANDLPNQSGGNLLDYNTMSVGDLGLNVTSNYSPNITSARNFLTEVYQNSTKNYNLLNTLPSNDVLWAYLPEETQDAISSSFIALQQNQNTVMQNAYNCYFQPTNCVQLAQDISAELQQYDQSLVAFYNQGLQMHLQGSSEGCSGDCPPISYDFKVLLAPVLENAQINSGTNQLSANVFYPVYNYATNSPFSSAFFVFGLTDETNDDSFEVEKMIGFVPTERSDQGKLGINLCQNMLSEEIFEFDGNFYTNTGLISINSTDMVSAIYGCFYQDEVSNNCICGQDAGTVEYTMINNPL